MSSNIKQASLHCEKVDFLILTIGYKEIKHPECIRTGMIIEHFYKGQILK